MSVNVRLDLRQSQQLVMTPQLQQAIKLLQMSNLEVSDYVDRELESNPLLEIGQPIEQQRARGESANDGGEMGMENPIDKSTVAREAADVGMRDESAARTEETFDTGMENIYADEARADQQTADLKATVEGPGVSGGDNWASVGKGGGSSFDNPEFDLEQTLTRDMTMREYLLEQLYISNEDAPVKMAAADMIENLNESGYLGSDLDEICTRLGAGKDICERALKLVQGLDPVGVGARSLSECLALQLADKNRLDPAIQKLLDNLQLLAKHEFAQLSKICEVDMEDIEDMVREIRLLQPKPGMMFNHEISQTVVPDVYVRQNELGGWSLELNTDTLPRVLVNTSYMSEVSRGANAEVKSYLTECQQNASWLVKSLDQRAKTILKVASEIVKQQDEFLAFGVSYLKPLNLKTVAEEISMHESTVSRVTSNKYISTERGVFEMKFFFTQAIASSNGGEAYSAQTVKHRVKTLIENEDPKKTLSDDKLVIILRELGVDIARRTVAKYRESMNIPSSVQRKRMKMSEISF